jgi:sugar phosphate isomerase/epimerase
MVSELRAALKEYDVDTWEVGAYRNILHPDESARQANLKYVAHCLEVAEKIGCRMASTITGSRNPEGNRWVDNYAVHPDNWTLETWKLTVSGVKQILKDTAGLKAALGMEAQVTTNLDGPIAHCNLRDDVGDPRLKVSLDPTNMVHFYNHFHTTELLNQCFDLLGEDIYGCAAKDSYVLPHSQTVHVQEVCPGRGSLDYETYLVRMSRMKWARSLNLEHFPTEQNPEACAYIRKVAAKVGVTVLG